MYKMANPLPEIFSNWEVYIVGIAVFTVIFFLIRVVIFRGRKR